MTSSREQRPNFDLVGTSRTVVVRETRGATHMTCWSVFFPLHGVYRFDSNRHNTLGYEWLLAHCWHIVVCLIVLMVWIRGWLWLSWWFTVSSILIFVSSLRPSHLKMLRFPLVVLPSLKFKLLFQFSTKLSILIPLEVKKSPTCEWDHPLVFYSLAITKHDTSNGNHILQKGIQG
jgi:hypothetical protein